MTPEGFFSAVAHLDDPDLLVVRSRVLQDSEKLRDFVNARREEIDPDQPAVKVEAYRGSDYPWRVICTRAEWLAWLAHEVEDITYTNFKNEVTKRQGRDRHDIYSSVWAVLLKLEKLPGAMRDHAKVAVEHPRWKGTNRWAGWGSYSGQMTLGDIPPSSSRMTPEEKAQWRRDELADATEAGDHAEDCDILDPDLSYDEADCSCGAWYGSEGADSDGELVPPALDADLDPRITGQGMHADCTAHCCVAPAGYRTCEPNGVKA